MRNKKPDILIIASSFISSFFVFTVLLFVYENANVSGTIAKALLVGACFALPALAAFICIHISAKVRQRKVKIELPALISGGTALMLILSFAAGFIGQLVYSFRINKEVTVTEGNSDIVLLLDDSGSMVPYTTNVRTASAAFVEGLSEKSRLALGIFAEVIGSFEDLVVMDDAGKQKIKDSFDPKYRFAGGTNFDIALQKASECLSATDEDTVKAVVMVTDGCDDVVSQNIQKHYINNDIKLYTIRIAGSEGKETQDLIDFVNKTGGFDTSIDMNSDPDAGLHELIDAFASITGSVESETKTEFSDGLLVYDEDLAAYKAVVRLIFIFILTLLVQLLYFRNISVKTVIANIITSVLACALLTFAVEISGVIVTVTASAALIFTAFAQMNIGEETDSNV